MQLLGHKNAFNFQLRQIETLKFFGENFVASKESNFLQKTLSLEIVERGGISIIMTTWTEESEDVIKAVGMSTDLQKRPLQSADCG
jgi:hypothetical protein